MRGPNRTAPSERLRDSREYSTHGGGHHPTLPPPFLMQLNPKSVHSAPQSLSCMPSAPLHPLRLCSCLTAVAYVPKPLPLLTTWFWPAPSSGYRSRRHRRPFKNTIPALMPEVLNQRPQEIFFFFYQVSPMLPKCTYDFHHMLIQNLSADPRPLQNPSASQGHPWPAPPSCSLLPFRPRDCSVVPRYGGPPASILPPPGSLCPGASFTSRSA